MLLRGSDEGARYHRGDRVKDPSPPGGRTLLDHWLPTYDVVERHSTRVRAPAERVWRVARELDFGRSPLIRTLFLLRSLPGLLTRGCTAPALGATLPGLLRSGFVLLGEREGEEMVLGLVGRFWTARGGVERVTPGEFQAWDRPGYARAAWSFSLSADADGAVRLSTETRVLCTDAGSRRRFLRYWRLVGPFSGLIRMEMLRAVRKAAERAG
jgi:hypothetical protein